MIIHALVFWVLSKYKRAEHSNSLTHFSLMLPNLETLMVLPQLSMFSIDFACGVNHVIDQCYM